MAKSAPLPGTSDIFPAEIGAWRFLENTARSVFGRYNFGELRTPIFEATEVFQRGLGDETEVVQKEMYTFEDRGGRSVTLRPEGTAGAMRALLNTDVLNGVEQRVFYIGPMFRGERPAAGRRRSNGLTVARISTIAGGKNAFQIGHRCVALQFYITCFVQFQLPLHKFGLRRVAQRYKQPLTGNDLFLPVSIAAHFYAGNFFVAENFHDLAVPDKVDFFVIHRPFGHDLGCPQFVAAVDNGYAFGKFGQEKRFFHS